MSISWLIASVILGKCIVRYGGKIVTIVSNVILLASAILLPTLGINSPLLLVLIYVFIMGFGFGGAFTTLTIIIQESVDYNKRGAATATNSLLRTLGQTIGVSVFGSIFNLYIVKYFTNIGITGVDPSNLYSTSSVNAAVTSEHIRLSINSSIHILFIILMVISVLALIFSAVMPKAKEETSAI
jgi:MFS family permease